MALVTIVEEQRTLRTPEEITSGLAEHGIDYERWQPAHPVSDDAPPEEILRAYANEIEQLKARGGYVTADVIEAQEFPDLARRYAVRGVPKIVINDEVEFVGALPESQFLAYVRAATNGKTDTGDKEEQI